MQIDIATGLIAMLQPFWLAAIPFALLPIVNELLKPGKFRPAQSGWRLRNTNSSRNLIQQSRLIKPALLGLGALFISIGLTVPTWPGLKFLEPRAQGHCWAMVLDSSGSMSIVDPGTTESRLKRLATALEQAIKNRPDDEFTIIRVAGYADRIGPATTDSRFLAETLQQIRPALPGEDGTSLGEGLILAAESLALNHTSPSNQSILVISDGRENRPDSSTKSITEIAPLLLKLKIQVDWLRVETLENINESIESKTLGEQSRIALENLVRTSGGTIANLNSSDDWHVLTASTIGNLKRRLPYPDHFSPIATVFLSIAFLIWTILFLIGELSTKRPARIFNRLASLSLFISTIFLGVGIFLILSRQSTPESQTNPNVKSRTLILMDASPSMAAIDTHYGSRLASSKRIANGLIQRLSLTTDRQASLSIFSGRAVGLSPWTKDWKSLDQIIESTEPNQIEPSGSNWESAFNSALEYYFRPENTSREIDHNIILITDGEASEPVSNETLKLLIDLNIRVHVMTLGTDRPPGMTFSVNGTDINRLWMDQTSKIPARSMRHDQTGRDLSDSTRGKFFPIGTSSFDAPQIADLFFNKFKASDFQINPARSSSPRKYIIVAFIIFLSCEIFQLLKNISAKRTLQMASLFGIISMIACNPAGRKSEVEIGLEASSTHLRNGNILGAEAILNQIRFKRPDEPVIFYNLGLLSITRQKPADAIMQLNHATRLLADSPTIKDLRSEQLKTRIQAALGYAQIQSGLWSEAIQSLKKAIQIDRNCTMISDAERDHIQSNLQFANRHQSGLGKPDKAQNETDQIRQTENTSLIKPDSPLQQLSELAEASRRRARTSRSRFQPAGDEMTKPADRLKTVRRMDW